MRSDARLPYFSTRAGTVHITNDIPVGSLLTIAITLAGFLVAAGRTTALLSQATKYITELRADFNSHVADDARKFDGLSAALNDAAIKQATVAATVTAMSATVSAMAAAQISGKKQETE